jgi:hypothetical protein
LGGETFLATAVNLPTPGAAALNLWVLKSFDRATAFLRSLNELLLALGLTALLAGSLLVFLISHTFTRPLETLVAGVRAAETKSPSSPAPLIACERICRKLKESCWMRNAWPPLGGWPVPSLTICAIRWRP